MAEIDLSELSSGSQIRIKRIQELRKYRTEEDVIEFCISAGWLAAEKLEMARQQRVRDRERRLSRGI